MYLPLISLHVFLGFFPHVFLSMFSIQMLIEEFYERTF